jgi:phosphoserine phosphatase
MTIAPSHAPSEILEHATAADLHAAVHALDPKVAVFDCDGTLWAPDSGSGFMRWTIETGLLPPESIAWLDERYARYKRGEVNELAICGEMVQVYAGLREQDLRQAAAIFFEKHVAASIFPEMEKLIADLQAGGVEIWAVSSTNDWVVEEGVRRFKIPANRVLCARVAVEDGIVTDRVLDVPTDLGKVTALNRVGITHPDAVFGNSAHDAAMLAIARRAFPINPSPALVERSVKEHWHIYYPELMRSI